MNTNSIKSFAKKSRILLLDGIASRLKYWGFEADGSIKQEVQPTQGGYSFRGSVYTDATVPSKWNKLKKRVVDKQAVLDCVEEAAYTWFNRLMAIKILEKNGYIPELLGYANEMRTPKIVQNAKNGQHALTRQSDINLLVEYLQEDKEDLAFALLITDFCNKNSVLHDVFGKIDDYTELLLPLNLIQKDGVLDLINSDAISDEDYKEVELIGWLYQFYISDRKDQVFADFKKNKKARAEDIPAATQIFTPKWIVKYMVENTVGKIYLDYEPTSLLRSEMKYLVVNESDSVTKISSIGNRSIISDLKELTLIDPACGSGHILVTGFELLFAMYREEGYTAKQAVLAILEHNLFGLDIDDRAMQLARFAVLLKAAKYDSEILSKSILPHIYSFPENTIDYIFNPQAISVSRLKEYYGYHVAEDVIEKWKEDFVDPDTGELVTIEKVKTVLVKQTIVDDKAIEFLNNNNVTSVLINTYKPICEFLETSSFEIVSEVAQALSLLRQGKNIGAALKLSIAPETYQLLEIQFQKWNTKYQQGLLDFLQTDLWNNLKSFLEVLLVMTKKFTAVVANPPYMGQGNMNGELKFYLNSYYPNSKSDLFAVFIEAMSDMLLPRARVGCITMESWMFLSSYEKLRTKIIDNYSIVSLAHFGWNVIGIAFGTATLILENSNDILKSEYSFLSHNDLNKISNEPTTFPIKDNGRYAIVPQSNFNKIPGSPIAYWVSAEVIKIFEDSEKLKNKGDTRQGMATSDNKRFLRFWHEVNIEKIGFNCESREKASESERRWFPYNKGGSFRKWYGNQEYVVDWENNGERILAYASSLYGSASRTVKSMSEYFKASLSWSKVTAGSFALRYYPKGFIFDVAGCCIFYENENDQIYDLGLLNSEIGKTFLSVLSPTLNYEAGSIANFPVKRNKEKINLLIIQKLIEISKRDWESKETSWSFEKSPLINENVSLIKSFQKWKIQVTQNFFQLHNTEEELNKIYIDIYGLKEELSTEVNLKDITILQDELDRNALEQLESVFREKGKEAIELPIKKEEVFSQFISYSIGVFLGRYRLDKPGLNIAHPNSTDEELSSYNMNGQLLEIDEDGIVPLMGENCAFPDDVLVRLKQLLLAVWGEVSLVENINFLQECLGMDLHKWLTEKFWGYHTGMYKKKPIYWLFTSNPKKPQNAAFKVLVYMHRMDKYTVQKIQRNYLHPHQEYINQEIDNLRSNESNLSKQELKRLETLMQWQLECRDYNEILKELANKQIEFDLDDGVDVNYANFEGAVAII